MTKQTFQQEVLTIFIKFSLGWITSRKLRPPLTSLSADNFYIFHEIYSIDQGTWLDGPGESANMKNKRAKRDGI